MKKKKLETQSDDSDLWAMVDDSDVDPTFDLLEESRSAFSKISIKKTKSKKGAKLENEDFEEIKIPELGDEDGRYFEIVEKLIHDGKLEKLKVDQYKIYLRKYGLRLSGTKEMLLGRIKEHLEIKDGGGERKYPPSSFELDCKGDACTGDVVMFEQKVYEMYNVASRSAMGPPCGTRIVAGRIAKESYGVAKQQHTFTVEVLWSKGVKSLPPLYPLLIKGRNLYRLKTMRQKWADEEQRMKVLQEKHARGQVARVSRENRIKEKEMKHMKNKIRTKENDGNNNTIAEKDEKKQKNSLPQNSIQKENLQSLNQSKKGPILIEPNTAQYGRPNYSNHHSKSFQKNDYRGFENRNNNNYPNNSSENDCGGFENRNNNNNSYNSSKNDCGGFKNRNNNNNPYNGSKNDCGGFENRNNNNNPYNGSKNDYGGFENRNNNCRRAHKPNRNYYGFHHARQGPSHSYGWYCWQDKHYLYSHNNGPQYSESWSYSQWNKPTTPVL